MRPLWSGLATLRNKAVVEFATAKDNAEHQPIVIHGLSQLTRFRTSKGVFNECFGTHFPRGGKNGLDTRNLPRPASQSQFGQEINPDRCVGKRRGKNLS